MRFLHTADWHLGIGAAHAGQAGERIRQERLHAAARVVAAAKEAGAEFVVVAGDMFDNNVCTAANGSAPIMPPPGLCRVLPLPTQPAWFLTVPDAA